MDNDKLEILISPRLDKQAAEDVKKKLELLLQSVGRNNYKIYTENVSRLSYPVGKKETPFNVPFYVQNKQQKLGLLSDITTAQYQYGSFDNFVKTSAEVGDNIKNWKKEIAVFNAYSSNAVNSFWSVWSISWAIRGTLQDIFGYSNRWVGEVNKLTRAFQSGLYLYAGSERILKGIGTKILQNNIHKQKSLQLDMEALALQRKIYSVRARLLTLDKKDTQYKTLQNRLSLLQSQKYRLTAQSQAESSLAEEETLNTRAALMGGVLKGVGYAAVAMAALGAIRWLENFNEESNKARRTAIELKNSLAALANPLNTLKIGFTDINSLVNKVTQAFPDLADQLNRIQDPIERLGVAINDIVLKASAPEKPTNFFGWLKKPLEWIKNIRENDLLTGKWAKEQGVGGILSLSEQNVEQNLKLLQIYIERYNNLKEILTGNSKQNELAGFFNQLMTLSSRAASQQIKDLDQLNKSYAKNKQAILDTLAPQLYKTYLEGIEAQKQKMLASATDDYTKAMIVNAYAQQESLGYFQNNVLGKWLDDMLKKAQKAITTTSKAKTSVMTLLDFYRQMYQAYKDAASHDTQYTKLRDYWQDKYIKQLKLTISNDLKELKTIQKGTELWKQKNIEIAKARQALADMLELSQKLKSTWWNIPTAVIRPTKAQLTSTYMVSPQFIINADTKEKIIDAVNEKLNNIMYESSLPTGTEGGAL